MKGYSLQHGWQKALVMSNQNFYECQVGFSLKKVPLISRKGVCKTGKPIFFETDVWVLAEKVPLISRGSVRKTEKQNFLKLMCGF